MPSPENRPILSTGPSHRAAIALASVESSPAHAAGEQTWVLLAHRTARRESLHHRRQTALFEQLAPGPTHALSHQAHQVPRHIGHLYLQGLVLGL